MEISENAMNILVDYKTINILNVETLKQLLKFVSNINERTDIKALAHTNNCSVSTINGAYASIISLFTEAIKYDYSFEKLNSRLKDTEIQKSHVEQLCEAYKTCKQQFYNRQQSIGNTLPHIIDIDWRLDYSIKSSTNHSTGVLYYHICLSTMKHNKLQYVKFTCTMQQLQELIHKLKDAVRHIEKLSTT